MPKLGYSRDGDTVTLTMSVGDYDALLISLGYAAGGDRAVPALFWARIALVNRLNIGNPNYQPYEIPEEFR